MNNSRFFDKLCEIQIKSISHLFFILKNSTKIIRGSFPLYGKNGDQILYNI